MAELARLYVSYRSTERALVSRVVSELARTHVVAIDYLLPPGADRRAQQLDDLRRADVFLMFVSHDTPRSAFQNAELGAARATSEFLGRKLIIPVLLDEIHPPASLVDIDCLHASHRDPERIARDVEAAIAKRRPQVRLFISHAHRDQDLASRLVDVIASGLVVPPGELRCTSVPGYKLDFGAAAPDTLRRELGSAVVVIGLLTPNSLETEWVLFELGAAWAQSRSTIPLLAGGLTDRDLPGPLRGAVGGQLSEPITLDQLLEQLRRDLSWAPRSDIQAAHRRYELAKYVQQRTAGQPNPADEPRASFGAKRERLGRGQKDILDYVASAVRTRPSVPFDEFTQKFDRLETSLFYRLEQLRLLGFLRRIEVDQRGGRPVFAWTLSDSYRRELHL